MKFKTIVIIAGAVFAIMGGLKLMAKTPEQPYEEITQVGKLEIRFYPKAVMATVEVKSNSYMGQSNQLFGKLAGYIFGGNQNKTKIAMTAPVYMDVADGKSQMSFVMPEGYHLGNLPRPDNSDVKLHESDEVYVAAIRFSGYASERNIEEKKEELARLLKEQGISHNGQFRYLGYNSPWDFVNRRNEVMVAISKADAMKMKAS